MTSLSLFTFLHWRSKWQPTPVFLPGESQGKGSLVGCYLWDRTESDMTEATKQQQEQHMYELLQLAHVGTRKLHLGPMHGVAEGDKAETIKDKSDSLPVLALMGRTILAAFKGHDN